MEKLKIDLENRLLAGANWFCWLAGLSLINSLIALMDGSWYFIFGLGITQLVDGFVMAGIEALPGVGTVFRIVGFGVNLVILSVFCLFGWLARRGRQGAFVVGMVLYALDAVLYLWVGDLWGLAFHGWVLYALFGGLRACHERTAPAYKQSMEVQPS